MQAWLPYENAEEQRRRIGELPEGVEFVSFTDPALPWPDVALDQTGFVVVPYLKGTESLARIEEMTSLAVVQLCLAGFEDFAKVVPDHIALCNASGPHRTATSEMALALMLAQGRHLDDYARNQAAGRWAPQWGESLADKRILILGYGHIGSAVEKRLQGFEVASITRVARSRRDGVHPFEELNALLPEADIVVVCCPLTEQTTRLLDAERLALLPDGAQVVNVGRGKVIDTDALVAEAASGRIRAALDVVDPEPLPPEHPLWRTPGVLISPHTGGPASAFWPRMDALIARQLRHWVSGEPLEGRVN